MCCNVLQKLLLILTGLLWKSVRYNSIRPFAKIQTGKLVSIFYKSLSFFWIQYNVSLKCSKICVINQPFNDQCSHHIEISQSICRANQLTRFNMLGTLVVRVLTKVIGKFCSFRICYKKVSSAKLEGGGGQVSPALFQKLEKSVLILGKNSLIVVVYGVNFTFKTQFLRVCRRKPEILPCGAYLSCVVCT